MNIYKDEVNVIGAGKFLLDIIEDGTHILSNLEPLIGTRKNSSFETYTLS